MHATSMKTLSHTHTFNLKSYSHMHFFIIVKHTSIHINTNIFYNGHLIQTNRERGQTNKQTKLYVA